MYEDMKAPEKIPERGFYYHYKHDPTGDVYTYAYEVMGVGHHTEDDVREEDRFMVVYRPLYDALVYRIGKLFNIRPLGMFLETVEKEGKTFTRFTRITDPALVAQLEAQSREMYGS